MEANGNLTLAHCDSGQLLLFAADHAFTTLRTWLAVQRNRRIRLTKFLICLPELRSAPRPGAIKATDVCQVISGVDAGAGHPRRPLACSLDCG